MTAPSAGTEIKKMSPLSQNKRDELHIAMLRVIRHQTRNNNKNVRYNLKHINKNNKNVNNWNGNITILLKL